MKRVLLAFLLVAVIAAGAWFAWKRLAAPPPPGPELLDQVQEAAFRYFWVNCDPAKGLILDRANNVQPCSLSYAPSSIAATGFGLAALPVGVERGWVSRDSALARALATLRAMRDVAQATNGFYYHFLDARYAKRHGQCEVSSIDTVLFLAGALTAGSYFGGEVETIARQLYERVNWPWMLDGDSTFSMGWKPERGFLPDRWRHYDESSLLYLMAIGSRTAPVPAGCWSAVKREAGEYEGHVALASAPLFTHQYSHLFVDFRNTNDGQTDFWASSVAATLANRQFCIEKSDEFRTYGENSWGLTACDGPMGYKAYGAPPGRAIHDGTIAPTAALGSFQFTPDLSWQALLHMRTIPGLWGLYGFADAYNLEKPDRPWIAMDAIGIDQGAILLSIENARSGLIWRLFSSRPEIQRALGLCGFKPGPLALRPSFRVGPGSLRNLGQRPELAVPRLRFEPLIDGAIDDAWKTAGSILLDESCRESGSADDASDASARVRVLWNENALFVLAEVFDEEIVARHAGAEMHRDDLVEIYIDPEFNALTWGGSKDFQIGLAPNGSAWAWFQGVDALSAGVTTAVARPTGGYTIEARIPWSFLGIAPRAGNVIGFCPALHDVDSRGSIEAKFSWFFLDPGIHLGRMVLAE